MKGVAILSGGLDSTVSVAAATRKMDVVLALTFDYGQRAAKRERAASARIAKHYGIPHRVIAIPWLAALTSTALVNRRSVLPVHEMSERSAKAVWVPNRNGVFIEIAAAHAESLGAERLITGFNKEEAVTFPDNSTAYVSAINYALSYSTANGVRVVSFTGNLEKKGIVNLGRRLNAPLKHIWPCYEGGKRWCGECESCLRSLRALHG
ncbi:MAG TPA: 7-cyano-7-deazaguanine synthase QueC [Planctomycetota bacterium]|nr:7-cyano-7-deazaguanine synthase QueC [Planctomycetota bacterium]